MFNRLTVEPQAQHAMHTKYASSKLPRLRSMCKKCFMKCTVIYIDYARGEVEEWKRREEKN